jgi:tetratricopeptide (TPR) repeat protein
MPCRGAVRRGRHRAIFGVPTAALLQVRLGLAYCFFKLKDYARARKAFERVLQLVRQGPGAERGLSDWVSRLQDSECVEALAGLAVLELNAAKGSEETIKRAWLVAMRARIAAISAGVGGRSQRLEHAYALNPQHTTICNMLATHFFYRQRLDMVSIPRFLQASRFPSLLLGAQALLLAQRAEQSAVTSESIAESSFQQARTYHAQGEYDRAYNLYLQATQKNPDHILAQFGFGQTLIHQSAPAAHFAACWYLAGHGLTSSVSQRNSRAPSRALRRFSACAATTWRCCERWVRAARLAAAIISQSATVCS